MSFQLQLLYPKLAFAEVLIAGLPPTASSSIRLPPVPSLPPLPDHFVTVDDLIVSLNKKAEEQEAHKSERNEQKIYLEELKQRAQQARTKADQDHKDQINSLLSDPQKDMLSHFQTMVGKTCSLITAFDFLNEFDWDLNRATNAYFETDGNLSDAVSRKGPTSPPVSAHPAASAAFYPSVSPAAASLPSVSQPVLSRPSISSYPSTQVHVKFQLPDGNISERSFAPSDTLWEAFIYCSALPAVASRPISLVKAGNQVLTDSELEKTFADAKIQNGTMFFVRVGR